MFKNKLVIDEGYRNYIEKIKLNKSLDIINNSGRKYRFTSNGREESVYN